MPIVPAHFRSVSKTFEAPTSYWRDVIVACLELCEWWPLNGLPVNVRLTDSHAVFRHAKKRTFLALLLSSLLLVYGWTFLLHRRSVFYVRLGTILLRMYVGIHEYVTMCVCATLTNR